MTEIQTEVPDNDKPIQLTRLEFLGVIGVSTLGGTLLGFVLRDPLLRLFFGQSRDRRVEIFSPLEITGLFPKDGFSFSAEVEETNLIPSVFSPEDSIETRFTKSVDYLRRLRETLKHYPEFQGPTLGELEIVSPANLALPFSPDDTIDIVLDKFLQDVGSGRVKLEPEVRNDDKILGTISTPIPSNGRWTLKSSIAAGTAALRNLKYQEENDYYYYEGTDVQLAIQVLHEYVHCKQDEAALYQLSPALTVDAARREISRFNSEQKSRIINTYWSDIEDHMDEIAFNEAQANATSQLALSQLADLNQTNRFPGLHDDDPYPINYESLYSFFLENVMKDKTQGENSRALDLTWLARHRLPK